jgi:hypothetical protein
MGFLRRLGTAGLVLFSRQASLAKIFQDALALVQETKAVVDEVRK